MDESMKDLASLIVHNFNNLGDIPDDEEIIIKYLACRYEQGQIYTWVGPLLLAINPGRVIHNLYDKDQHEKFTNISNIVQKNVEPHVFAVAARAHYKLTHGLGRVNQVIIISGDSGSGKTFSAGNALNFLASMNQSSTSICHSRVSKTILKISSASPLLSAFSTASTERNKYSSRHGQLVQLQYLGKTVHGAIIHTFLLEKNRVTSGHNNFHIFYQLLAGLPDSDLDALKLSRSTKYNIINVDHNVTEEHHIEGYHETVAAMEDLGFKKEQRDDVFKLIALLIHMGNIQFKEEKAGRGCLVDVDKKESREALEAACTLISLPVDDLTELLTSTLINPQSLWRRHTIYHRAIDTIETCHNRLCSIIRYFYERLFQWIVDRLNKTLRAQGQDYNLLGILDIFGFESFSVNGIEQLSINYASERLQLYFVEEYLEVGRQELEGEGLNMLPPPPTTRIYQQRLAVIEGSVFTVLNDACVIPASDGNPTPMHRLIATGGKSIGFLHTEDDAFVIKHYAGPVKYSTVDMLPKNTDKVPVELASAFTLCDNELLLSLIKSNDSELRQNGRFCGRKNTTLAKLKQSLDALIKELNKCDSHYIRCVRPGSKGCCMDSEFRAQLTCSGVLDALPLARCVFPIRLRYEEFHKRYSNDPTESCDLVQRCKEILEVGLNRQELQSSVHFGSRLIFLTEAILNKLEYSREEYHNQCANKIKRFWSKYKDRKKSNLPERRDTKNLDGNGNQHNRTHLTIPPVPMEDSLSSIGSANVFSSSVPSKPYSDGDETDQGSSNWTAKREEPEQLYTTTVHIKIIVNDSNMEVVEDDLCLQPCRIAKHNDICHDDKKRINTDDLTDSLEVSKTAFNSTNLSEDKSLNDRTGYDSIRIGDAQESDVNASNISHPEKHSIDFHSENTENEINDQIDIHSQEVHDDSIEDNPEISKPREERNSVLIPQLILSRLLDDTSSDKQRKCYTNEGNTVVKGKFHYDATNSQNEDTAQYIYRDLYLELDDDTRRDSHLDTRTESNKESVCRMEVDESMQVIELQSGRNKDPQRKYTDTKQNFYIDLYLELDDDERRDSEPESQAGSNESKCGNDCTTPDISSDLHLELADDERCDSQLENQAESDEADSRNEEGNSSSTAEDSRNMGDKTESCVDVAVSPLLDESDGVSTCQLHSSREDLTEEGYHQVQAKGKDYRREYTGLGIMDIVREKYLLQIQNDDFNNNLFVSDDQDMQEAILAPISEIREPSLEQDSSNDAIVSTVVEESDSETSSTTIITVKHSPRYKQSEQFKYRSQSIEIGIKPFTEEKSFHNTMEDHENIDCTVVFNEQINVPDHVPDDDTVSEMNSEQTSVQPASNVSPSMDGNSSIKLSHLENLDIAQWLNGAIYTNNIKEARENNANIAVKTNIQEFRADLSYTVEDKTKNSGQANENLEGMEGFDSIVDNNLIPNKRSEVCMLKKSSSESNHSLYSDITFSNTSLAPMITLSNRPDCLREVRLGLSDYIQQYSYNIPPVTDPKEAVDCSATVILQIYDAETTVIHDNNDTTYRRSKKPKIIQNWNEGLSSKLCETIELKPKIKAPMERPWTRLLRNSKPPFRMENYGDHRKRNHTVYLDNQLYFYNNGIFSRRRLSEVPVRFHTRLTCLSGSHRLPRSELPEGLQDCL